jgi:hypothetical protein
MKRTFGIVQGAFDSIQGTFDIIQRIVHVRTPKLLNQTAGS